jgi:hypothetical protein
MNNNGNKSASCCLKYLNLGFGILMLIVATHNIEQVLHNRHIYNSELLNVNETECKTCQIQALTVITNINRNQIL